MSHESITDTDIEDVDEVSDAEANRNRAQNTLNTLGPADVNVSRLACFPQWRQDAFDAGRGPVGVCRRAEEVLDQPAERGSNPVDVVAKKRNWVERRTEEADVVEKERPFLPLLHDSSIREEQSQHSATPSTPRGAHSGQTSDFGDRRGDVSRNLDKQVSSEKHERVSRFERKAFNAPPLKCPRSAVTTPPPEHWARGAWAPLGDGDVLNFFLVTVEDRCLPPPQGFVPPGRAGQCGQIIDMHGTTRNGCSVLLHVHGFTPYFFVQRPTVCSFEDCCRTLRGCAEVADIVEVEKFPLMYYQDHKDTFLRVSVWNQKSLGIFSAAFEKGLQLPDGSRWSSSIMEGNVPYILRFMVDMEISGGSWISVTAGRFLMRASTARTSTAQCEADTHWTAVAGYKAEGKWLGIAPLRLLSVFLVTAGCDAHVVAAGTVLREHGRQEPRHRAAWAVSSEDSACPGSGAQLFLFGTEAELLRELQEYVSTADPDIIVGHDLLNGHLNTLLTRAEATRAAENGCFSLGRLLGVPSKAKGTTFETRQLGRHVSKDINADGRVLFDVLSLLEKEQKQSSYSLSALAGEFLGSTRVELRVGAIERLSREHPAQLASHAVRDAELSLKLFESQQCLVRYVEMARVTGVPIDFLLKRGQSIKVLSMLLRKARAHDFVMPAPGSQTPTEDTYEGGAVLDPTTGFYDQPIVTLDFASLYPSIMQAHNLCYTTLLRASGSSPLAGDSVEDVPGLVHRFVASHVRRGILPLVLEELLTARASAKRAMKSAEGEMKVMLNGRQLALKLSANSVYGFTGMSVGALPCQAIAASVTAYGRRMIEHTAEVVEGTFCKARGFEVDAKVIYGDTDSVMVSFGLDFPIDKAFDVGHRAASLVSREFPSPVKLEFEKVYFPYLLMSKKRYAGVARVSPEEAGKLDAKGIEVVRRDWCALVRHVVQQSLDSLLLERSIDKAVITVKETLSALRLGKVDHRFLVISKQLVRDGIEKYSAKQAHVELAERLRKRDSTTAPQVGDRVSYVFVVGEGKSCDKVEDPRYAIEHGLQIDSDYYIEHQVRQPLLRIFGPVLGADAAAQQLFGGDDARVKRTALVSRGPMKAFFRTQAKCLGCRNVLRGEESTKALCSICVEQGRATNVVLTHTSTLQTLEYEGARLLSQCVRCEGSGVAQLYKDCVNVDCPVFFRRLQVGQELASSQAAFQRLHLDW